MTNNVDLWLVHIRTLVFFVYESEHSSPKFCNLRLKAGCGNIPVHYKIIVMNKSNYEWEFLCEPKIFILVQN